MPFEDYTPKQKKLAMIAEPSDKITAADLKNLKPVEPYKAKGIKERGQFVLRKEGKKK